MMCEHGDTVPVRVHSPGWLTHSGEPEWRTVPVDRCIAPIVEWLASGSRSPAPRLRGRTVTDSDDGVPVWSCSTCVYSEAAVLEDGPVFECRRFPPQIVVPEEGDVLQVWPQVSEGEWCGEHDRRPGSGV